MPAAEVPGIPGGRGVLVAGMEVRRRSSGEDLALLPVDLPAVGVVPFC